MYRELFEIAGPGVFNACYLGEVNSVADPLNLARVQVRLFAFDGAADQDALLWARVAVPFAGSQRGAFLLPGRGDEVLVSFVNGDSRLPVVVGALWNGRDKPPETLSRNEVDRWSIVGSAGTRIAIVEESAATATIKLSTPGGATAELTDAAGGRIKLKVGGSKIELTPAGVTITASGPVTVKAANVDVSAGTVKVSAAMSQFSGVVQCDTLITNTVVATTYTPGAGNVW